MFLRLIKGYACTCFQGKRQAGCCVHAGVLIYYLSYAKYNNILLPGEHLNAVLVDLEKNESPNKPRYVTHKRRKLFTEKSIHFQWSHCYPFLAKNM